MKLLRNTSEDTRIMTAPDKAAEPVIPEGASLLCAKNMKPFEGDFVILIQKNSDAAPMLRQFMVHENSSILLQAPNKTYDSYVTTLDEINGAGELYVVLKMERDFQASSRLILSPGAYVSGLRLASEGESSQMPRPSSALPQEPPPTVVKASAEPMAMSEVLTFEETQDVLKVRRTKLYELLRSGELEASKIGKLWRIDRNSIVRYMSERTFKKNE